VSVACGCREFKVIRDVANPDSLAELVAEIGDHLVSGGILVTSDQLTADVLVAMRSGSLTVRYVPSDPDEPEGAEAESDVDSEPESEPGAGSEVKTEPQLEREPQAEAEVSPVSTAPSDLASGITGRSQTPAARSAQGLKSPASAAGRPVGGSGVGAAITPEMERNLWRIWTAVGVVGNRTKSTGMVRVLDADWFRDSYRKSPPWANTLQTIAVGLSLGISGMSVPHLITWLGQPPEIWPESVISSKRVQYRAKRQAMPADFVPLYRAVTHELTWLSSRISSE
jgi:hypothetical protein